MKKTVSMACVLAAAFGFAAPASAVEPGRPVEFVVTGGPGGGIDVFARAIQSIIGKYDRMTAPGIVTDNAYLPPDRAIVPCASADLTPVAALAADDFVL